jgi:hypothetical protein
VGAWFQIRDMQEENTALQNELKQRRAQVVEDGAISTQQMKDDTTACQEGTECTEIMPLGLWDRKEPMVIVVLQSVCTIQVSPRLTPRSFQLLLRNQNQCESTRCDACAICTLVPNLLLACFAHLAAWSVRRFGEGRRTP